ncbi:unnamed protein product [Amoebophrya sp. A120]|nr:unnamed protein product [Amoebophrya sp. A120]|eukprot:GSA120T00009990001.1
MQACAGRSANSARGGQEQGRPRTRGTSAPHCSANNAISRQKKYEKQRDGPSPREQGTTPGRGISCWLGNCTCVIPAVHHEVYFRCKRFRFGPLTAVESSISVCKNIDPKLCVPYSTSSSTPSTSTDF